MGNMGQKEETGPAKRLFRQDWVKMAEENRYNKRNEGPRKVNKSRANYVLRGNGGGRGGRATDGEKRHQKREKIYSLDSKFPPDAADIFVSCLPGLENVLAQEIEALGCTGIVEAGGVTIEAGGSGSTQELVHSCHLRLGTASHVLIRCGEPFTARGLAELTRKVSLQPWHKFIVGQRVPVQMNTTSKKSKLNHNTAIRTAILEGINRSLNARADKPILYPASESDRNIFKMVIRIERDEARISIDTSETPLHRRGYRLETAKAPLREDLAYSMLYGAGWRMIDAEGMLEPKFKSFLDPLCGSGTIAIEAASIAAGLPPGRLRDAPLRGTIWYSNEIWQSQLQAVQQEARQRAKLRRVPIAASDRDRGAIESAKANAARAGVQDWIEFKCVPISAQEILAPKNQQEGQQVFPCLIATNPPWGLRISSDKKKRKNGLLPLYDTLIERQNSLNREGSSVTAVTLLRDLNLFRKTGADLRVMWSSNHGGVSVAAVLTGQIPESESDKPDAASRKLAREKAIE